MLGDKSSPKNTVNQPIDLYVYNSAIYIYVSRWQVLTQEHSTASIGFLYLYMSLYVSLLVYSKLFHIFNVALHFPGPWPRRIQAHCQRAKHGSLGILAPAMFFVLPGDPELGLPGTPQSVESPLNFAAPNSNYKSCEHRLAACSVFRLESLLESRLFGRQWILRKIQLRKIQHAILVQHEKGFTEKRFTEKLVGVIFKCFTDLLYVYRQFINVKWTNEMLAVWKTQQGQPRSHSQNCSCTPRKWHFEVSSYFSVGLGTARSRVASKHPNGISESVAILAAVHPNEGLLVQLGVSIMTPQWKGRWTEKIWLNDPWETC